MKSLTCDYFPPLPARWHCSHCDRNLSTPCIRARDNHWDPVPEQRCPICLGALESLGLTHSIPPFWTRLPQFLAYPLKLEALVYLLAATLINFLPSFSADGYTGVKVPFFKFVMIGAVCLPLSTGILLTYAFNCLNHSAKGHLTPPSAVLENYSAVNFFLVVKQLLIYLIFSVLVLFSQWLGTPAFIALLSLILIAIPASTIILAITGSMPAAMNPLAISNIIKSIGWRYGIFYALLLFMLTIQLSLQSQSLILIPDFFLFPVLTLIQGYFSFAMFAMMGYVLYQYHEKLGLKGVNEFESDNNRVIPELSPDAFMNEITILLREDLSDVAIKRLKAKIYDTGALVYHERLNQIFQDPAYTEQLLQHGSNYIDAIFRSKEPANKQLQMAANAYQACLRVNPDFFYPDAKIVFKLANYAQHKGRHHLTRDLLTNFQERFPGNRLIPEACFLLATTLVEHLGGDKEVKQVLQFLLNTYPEHPLIPQVQEYLQLLNQLEK